VADQSSNRAVQDAAEPGCAGHVERQVEPSEPADRGGDGIRTWSSTVTSATATARVRGPFASAWAQRVRVDVRGQYRAPSPSSRATIAAPIPDAPRVTRATCPSNRPLIGAIHID